MSTPTDRARPTHCRFGHAILWLGDVGACEGCEMRGSYTVWRWTTSWLAEAAGYSNPPLALSGSLSGTADPFVREVFRLRAALDAREAALEGIRMELGWGARVTDPAVVLDAIEARLAALAPAAPGDAAPGVGQ